MFIVDTVVGTLPAMIYHIPQKTIAEIIPKIAEYGLDIVNPCSPKNSVF